MDNEIGLEFENKYGIEFGLGLKMRDAGLPDVNHQAKVLRIVGLNRWKYFTSPLHLMT